MNNELTLKLSKIENALNLQNETCKKWIIPIKQIKESIETEQKEKKMIIWYEPDDKTSQVFKVIMCRYLIHTIEAWIDQDEFEELFPNNINPYEKYTIEKIIMYELPSLDKTGYLFEVKKYRKIDYSKPLIIID